MKGYYTNANFPRTADQRVYHLGLRPGEVANRIVTVGDPSRARAIAAFLDAIPKPFTLFSERGFLTITGRYKGVPVSILSIGMGSPNMDFFVREVRECLSGDMMIIRLGSCGALIDVSIGSVVIPKASVAVIRNVDFDFANSEDCEGAAYRISKPAHADPVLCRKVHEALEAARPRDSDAVVLANVVNASADSFYSSQGRQSSFPDHNANLLEHLKASTKDLASIEMETFHLYHLAACWGGRDPFLAAPALLRTSGPTISPTSSETHPSPTTTVVSEDFVIRAAAAHMVFASRESQDFITPEQVAKLETWTGQGILNALTGMEISPDRLHSENGSVWEL